MLVVMVGIVCGMIMVVKDRGGGDHGWWRDGGGDSGC